MPLSSDSLQPNLPPAFVTHKNYLEVLNRLTNGVSLQYTYNLSRSPIPYINSKKKLIILTNKSIEAEIDVRNADPEYATAALPWIPAKIYYLLYYHQLTLEYLICCDRHAFNLTHFQLAERLTKHIENGRLVFSQPILNETFTIKELLETRQASATQLRRTTDDSILFQMLMKNTARHCLEDQKRMKKWNGHTTFGKRKIAEYCDRKISIFYHPLVMRHRTNYKNIDFADGVPTNNLANYFDRYISYGENISDALGNLCMTICSQHA